MTDLNDSIDQASRLLAVYDRVHEELDDGKSFDVIDCGFRVDVDHPSYEYWQAYMQQRLINALREIVSVRKLHHD